MIITVSKCVITLIADLVPCGRCWCIRCCVLLLHNVHISWSCPNKYLRHGALFFKEQKGLISLKGMLRTSTTLLVPGDVYVIYKNSAGGSSGLEVQFVI